MRATRTTALLLTATLLCGCQASAQPPEKPSRKPAATPSEKPTASPAPVPSAAGLVREGLVGLHSSDPFTVKVESLERHSDLTVLRMDITTTKDGDAGGDFGYDGLPSQSVSFGRFRLFDPVGRKVYFTLRENDAEGLAFGTRHALAGAPKLPDRFLPGVHYPVEVYFPPLPPQVRQVSIVPDLAIAPFTGVPVTGGGRPPVARERDGTATPAPGSAYQWPVVPPGGTIWSGISDVHELVETPERTTEQNGTQETIGLRTDVLFRFDKANLTDKAATVLDQVAQETRERADPDKPPIVIEGHTDGKGEPGYNQTLSVKRAEAVRAYLAGKLGDTYVYKATGKGESEPIAPNTKQDGSDDPEGRARNRRVEISYQIKQDRPGATTTTRPSADKVRGSVREPAPFRPDPGPVVGSLSWQRFNDRLRVDVHPFYRDGAYLVAVFDVVLESPQIFIPIPAPFMGGSQPFSSGSDYGTFTLVDPATKARYHPLKMYTEFVENFVLVLDQGEVNRSYVYFPAPADSATSITLEADQLGTVPDIPIS
ncbi:OmpA family protein [Nonomuraea phyllanthi]|uniref:OmpA family protein n=1 Tax=Nonomuraea phyllanthi TaxID=2219224 RepID=UPI001292FFF6|nr:OmpA family protein [Nonomuraea phyllanthi]QFY11080.1 OmpA family protein [Nonomuraea phyllanthi]